MIVFNKFNVVDKNTKIKARVHYSLDNRTDGKNCVTIYAKDYDNKLGDIFAQYKNESNSITDYHDKGKVNLFEGDNLYDEARRKVESFQN